MTTSASESESESESEPPPSRDSAAAPESAAPPERVGPYRVGARIGRGGMGSVHEAIEIATGRRVALKLVKEGASERACARLLREARAARTAAGAHVVEVLGAGLDDAGRPYVAMELLEGEDLAALLRREGRLELDDALDVAGELLEGLERVHAAGVVHRDLKPENLVIVGPLTSKTGPITPTVEGAQLARGGADGAPRAPRMKIVDFGVSKVRAGGVLVPGSLTREGIVLGTPLYMSPEQAQGLADVDERSDLWSAGAILYQCLAGRAPYAGGTYEQIVVAVCSTDAEDIRTRNPAVPDAIAAVLRRALSRDRGRRFQDARSMRLALTRARAGDLDAAALDASTLAGDPVLTPPASSPTEAIPLRRKRTLRPRGALAVAATSLALGVLVAIVALSAFRWRSNDIASGEDADTPAVAPAPRAVDAPAPTKLLQERAPVSEAPPDSSGAVAPPPRAPAAPASAVAPASRKRGIGAGLELKER